MNGALFRGRQVIKPGELEPADAQAVYLGKEASVRKDFRTVVDKVRMWRGRLIHILAVENQNYVDYHMVVRNMLSESLNYQKQWRQKKREHDRKKDLRAGTDGFLSGMEKDEKFMPVITLVVYCGMEHPWDGARCLHDLLEVEEELGRILQENREAYSRLDDDTRELIEVIAKVRVGEEYEIVENGERRYDMCKAFMDMKLEGIEEGIEKGIEKERASHLIETVCKKLLKNKPAEVIAEELEEELEAVENVIRIQRQVGNYDVKQIYEAVQIERQEKTV